MQDTIARTWTKSREGWPGSVLAWLGSLRGDDDDDTGHEPGGLLHPNVGCSRSWRWASL